MKAGGRLQFSVVTRLLLLLAFGMVSMLLYAWLHFWEHEKQERKLINAYVRDFDRQVNLVLDLHQESLETFVYDYSWWDDMVAFVSSPTDAAWALIVGGAPERYRVDAVWVLNPQGERVYGVDLTLGEESKTAAAPISPGEVASLFVREDFPVFFLNYGGQIIQIAAAPIHFSESDHQGEAQGYLLAGRYWTPQRMKHIGDSLASSLRQSVMPFDEVNEGELLTYPEAGEVTVFRIGRNPSGEPVMAYSVHHIIPGLRGEADVLDWHSGFVFVVVLIFSIIFVFYMVAWVLLPLRQLSRALEADDDQGSTLSSPPGREWTRLAGLVKDSIVQRKALMEEVTQRKEAEAAQIASEAVLREHYQDRERLARDLHDGVIQSVYAAGLQVETARLEFDRNPESARELLTEARQSLNHLIADVRRFISGLTPSRLEEANMLASLQKLAQPFRQAGIEVVLDLDEAALNLLSRVQKIQVFFMTQELLSNAARHGKATHIRVTVKRLDDEIHLDVTDNGIGFKEGDEASQGHGLKNLRQRADNMDAKIAFCCPESGGTCVCLILPLPQLQNDD